MGIRRHLVRARSGPRPPEGPSSFGDDAIGHFNADASAALTTVRVRAPLATPAMPLTPPCNVGQIRADGRVQAVKRGRKASTKKGKR